MHPVSTSAVSRGKKCVKQPALSSHHSVGHVPCLLKVYSFAPGYTRVLTTAGASHLIMHVDVVLP